MQREQRSGQRRKDDLAASAWKEKELVDGKIIDAGVVILRTAGCSHFHRGGCSMCGYNISSDKNVTPASIKRQFETAVNGLGEIQLLKIYTSGSFLDECEIPAEVTKEMLERCGDENIRLLFESRPEYVTAERIDEFLGIHEMLEIALGLESANDRVLKYSINKGFSFADYETAAKLIVNKGIDLRTYVLLKPPFLTEYEAIADSISTINRAAALSKTISLNPVNVQKGTLVEKLWRNWAYRPPWLWSVMEVLRATSSLNRKIICDPTGGGKERGTHNCGECDDVILNSIRSYSLSQDSSRLGSPDCDCVELWRTILDTEGFVIGGTVDLQRFFRMHRA